MEDIAKMAEIACEQFRLSREKMERIAKNAYEQFRSAGIPCEDPFCYRGLAEFIRVGRGSMTIEENDKKFEYFYNRIPKKYAKKVESIMKNLGVEKYVNSPNGDT
jgi:hypothetical protein